MSITLVKSERHVRLDILLHVRRSGCDLRINIVSSGLQGKVRAFNQPSGAWVLRYWLVPDSVSDMLCRIVYPEIGVDITA